MKQRVTHLIPQTTVCQYNIDVKYPPELEDNCDLALCIKNLNLDAGDSIKINHRDIQVRLVFINKCGFFFIVSELIIIR